MRIYFVWVFLLFFLGFSLFSVAQNKENNIIQYKEGRVSPVFTNLGPNMRVIPSKREGEWLNLNTLEVISPNPSQFSDKEWKALQKLFKKEDQSAFLSLLESSQKRVLFEKGERISLIKASVERWIFSSHLLEALTLFFFVAAFFCYKGEGGLLFIGAQALLWIYISLKMWILERPPVTNMQETIPFFTAIFSLLGTCFFYQQKKILSFFSLATSSALFSLLFFATPYSFGALPPVLNSNFWLLVHVLMVVGSYAFFAAASLYAHIRLISYNRGIEREIFPLLFFLYSGIVLLGLGTLLGGVWAAQSWGRFWDWDPKESWAFISILWYLAWVHLYRLRKISTYFLDNAAIIGFILITFTWYGVNYLLGSGLHSYGFGEGTWIKFLIWCMGEVFFLFFFRKKFSLKQEKRE